MPKAREKASRAPARSTEKQLTRYREMRDFKITSEPVGHKPKTIDVTLPFVIQKHAATRLHYDFRLGWNGVLKSWAVTKGPSYVPGDKRLAVQVEDHPMEYGGFEGIIPRGQYGGGTVMLWDRGTWEPHVDVDEGLRNGSLKFALYGEKMKGNWALIRMGGRAANEKKPNWLLIKEHDEQERAAVDRAITDEAPDSVLSGRTMDAIARDGDRVWQSNRSQEKAIQEKAAAIAPIPNRASSAAKATPKAQKKPRWSRALSHFPREALPSFVPPQLASFAKAPPVGGRWVHELKLDGYRIQARLDRKNSAAQLLTRTGLDWTHRMKSVAAAVLELPVDSALLDGEVVVLESDGTSSFAKLQAAFQEGARHAFTYFVFDLLHLDGHNLRNLPLLERKKLLADMLADSDGAGIVRLSEHIVGDAAEIFAKACGLGAEGIISKLSDAKYTGGRGSGWLKLKCGQEQEFVIGGFTHPSNGAYGVGALMLGYYRDGELIYAGRTGTGFTQKTHQMLRDRLEKIRRATSPFGKLPTDVTRGVIWVKPELVAQVAFSTWTADNLVRQAALKGLREDKPADSVVREDSRIASSAEAEAAPEKQAATNAGHPTGPLNRQVTKNISGDLPVKLTHPDKVLDAESGITKKDLARYYLAVSDTMLPYISNRPLTLVRCPDGSGRQCFYQKHKTGMLGANFESVEVVDRKSGKPEPYITLSTPTAIVELAQIGVLEAHPWGSCNDSLEQPDRIIFDLDPDETISWETLATTALEVRRRLKALKLESFVKSTGGKGLHVVVPIRPSRSWPEVKTFAHDFVLAMEKDSPSLFLTKMAKAARKGKIYLDYLRNERGSTAVAPYSPRARAGLPVAIPLSWSELKAPRFPRFTVSEFPQWKNRLARDPWKGMLNLQQSLIIPESE
jgi:bifunctional non-homologous end joining protein LigD